MFGLNEVLELSNGQTEEKQDKTNVFCQFVRILGRLSAMLRILLIQEMNIKHITWLRECQCGIQDNTFSNYGVVLLWAAEAFYWCQLVFWLQSREAEAYIFPRDLGVALPQRQVFKSSYKYFSLICVSHACGYVYEAHHAVFSHHNLKYLEEQRSWAREEYMFNKHEE